MAKITSGAFSLWVWNFGPALVENVLRLSVQLCTQATDRLMASAWVLVSCSVSYLVGFSLAVQCRIWLGSR